MSDNADQAAYWNEVAGAKWVANQDRLDAVFRPLTQALMERAGLTAGESVIDVGCGCGETSLLAAARVGIGGRVLALDLSRPMLDRARSRADGSGAASAPIVWTQADAMTHRFSPIADVVISRFGVMFFADQTAAFRNLRQGLKPGGRFAFLCWRPRDEVEWMQWPLPRVASVLPPPEAMIGQRGPFGLADAAATRRVFEAAGFSSLEIVPVDAALTIGRGSDAVDDAMALLRDTGPIAALLREADPAMRASAERLLRTALDKQVHGGEIRFGGACWLYAGCA